MGIRTDWSVSRFDASAVPSVSKMKDNGYYVGGRTDSEWIQSDATARALGVEDDGRGAR